MVNWPKRQYLHAITAPTTTTTKTTASIASTTKAEGIERDIWENKFTNNLLNKITINHTLPLTAGKPKWAFLRSHWGVQLLKRWGLQLLKRWGKSWTKSNHILYIQIAYTGISAILFECITVSRWKFWSIMSGMFNIPKSNMYLLILLLILLQPLLLLLPIQCYCFYYCFYYYCGISTIKAMHMEVNAWQNIEGKFELNKKTLCACRLPIGHISRMNLGIKPELSDNT